MFWSWEAEEEAAVILAAAVEVGLFCTLRTKRCYRDRSWSPSVMVVTAAAMTEAPPAMVSPAPLMVWWQMAVAVAMTMAKWGRT